MTLVQANVGSWKLEDCPQQLGREHMTCDECGRSYQKPILARVSTPGHVQTYGACPHCMTKVYDINVPEIKEKEQQNASPKPRQPSTAAEPEVKCDHFFGFLNKRTKGTPVPEPCLTCDRMVDCLYG